MDNISKELKPIDFRKVISKPKDLKIIAVVAEQMNLEVHVVCHIALCDGLKRLAENNSPKL